MIIKDRLGETTRYFINLSAIGLANKLLHPCHEPSLSLPRDDSLKSYKPIRSAGALL